MGAVDVGNGAASEVGTRGTEDVAAIMLTAIGSTALAVSNRPVESAACGKGIGGTTGLTIAGLDVPSLGSSGGFDTVREFPAACCGLAGAGASFEPCAVRCSLASARASATSESGRMFGRR